MTDKPEPTKTEKAVTVAEQTVATIQRKRSVATARVEEIAISRKRLGFAVHAANDMDARAQLDNLNTEDVSLAGELQSLDGALAEAERLLAVARDALARDQRRAEIREHQKLSKQFRELGPFLDKATNNLRKGLIALRANSPVVGRDLRHVQTLHRCMSVAFFDTPFRDAFGVPDAGDRRTFSTFSGVIDQWCDSTDNALRQELQLLDAAPDKPKEAA
jgi:hypothetical protein